MYAEEELPHNWEKAIAALMARPTIDQAAADVGVTDHTLRRWMSEPTFQREFRAARRAAFEQAIAKLQETSWAAVVTLVDLLRAQSEHVRLHAARSILETALKGMETLDMAERLEALERAMEERR